MKIINRAIIKELALTFSLSLISLNFFLIMENMLRLSRVLTGVGAAVSDLAKIVFYIQPQIMMLTMPMSLLLSTLLTYGRLNADNELIALRTAGMPFREIARPVFMLGTACFLAGLLLSFYFSPVSAGRLRHTISDIIVKRAPMAIEAGVFNTAFRDIVILVKDKPLPGSMKGIFIYDSRDKKEPRIMVAKEGRITVENQNLSLYLKDGHIHIAGNESSLEIFFKGYNLSLNLALGNQSRKEAELTPAEMLHEIREKGTKDGMLFLLDFHRRLSLPVLCLVLMFLGPPLALMSGRTDKLSGLTIGFAVFSVFYVMLIYGENMARSGAVPHYIGAWAPVGIIGLFSVWAFNRGGRQ